MEVSSLAQMICVPSTSWELPFAPYSREHFAFCADYTIFVADAFLSGGISFEVADRAMNCLFAYSYAIADRGMPDIAMEVYEAFDQGEFQHEGDPLDADPIDLYTKPLVQKAIARYVP